MSTENQNLRISDLSRFLDENKENNQELTDEKDSKYLNVESKSVSSTILIDALQPNLQVPSQNGK